MTCTFMIAVSQYVRFSFSVRVLAIPEQFNCKHVHLVCQLLAGVLLAYCSLYSSDYMVKLFIMIGVGFGGIIWMWHLVGGSYTT